MDSWKSVLIGLALVALFAYSLLNFANLIQVNNNVNSSDSILNSPMLKPFNSTLSSNLNELGSASEAQYNASIGEQKEQQNPSGALILGSVFSSLGRFAGFIFGFGNGFISLLFYLVQDTLVQGVLFSIFIIVVIAAIWRWWKWGQ